MITLLDPAHWVTRIKAGCPIFQQRAFESLDINLTALDLHEPPFVLVHVAGDESQPSMIRDSVTQIHENQVAVKTVVRKTYKSTDHLGGTDARLIRLCRIELLNGLLGWIPPDGTKRVEHVSGELIEKDDFLIWKDLYQSRDILRKP